MNDSVCEVDATRSSTGTQMSLQQSHRKTVFSPMQGVNKDLTGVHCDSRRVLAMSVDLDRDFHKQLKQL